MNEQFEREKWQAEQIRQDRDFALREREQAFKEAESRRSRWASPVVLAVLAAAVAGLGNAYVAWLNGDNQAQLELQKQATERSLEEQKTEYARMLEIMKIADAEKAARNLGVFFEAGLVSDPNKREKLKIWLAERASSQSGNASTPTAPPNPAASPTNPSVAPPIIEPYQTGWLGGGNTQPQQCSIGRAVVSQKHPGKTILLAASSEESKKDLWGHVEYRHFCTFQVQ